MFILKHLLQKKSHIAYIFISNKFQSNRLEIGCTKKSVARPFQTQYLSFDGFCVSAAADNCVHLSIFSFECNFRGSYQKQRRPRLRCLCIYGLQQATAAIEKTIEPTRDTHKKKYTQIQSIWHFDLLAPLRHQVNHNNGSTIDFIKSNCFFIQLKSTCRLVNKKHLARLENVLFKTANCNCIRQLLQSTSTIDFWLSFSNFCQTRHKHFKYDNMNRILYISIWKSNK